MFCSNCGQLLKDGSNFCNNCGARVTFITPPVTENEPTVEKVIPEEPAREEAPLEEQTETLLNEEKKAEPETEEVQPEPAAEEPAETAEDVQPEAPAESAEEAEPEPITEEAAEEPTETAEETPPEEAVQEPEPAGEETPAEPQPEPVKEAPVPEKKKNRTPLLIGIAAALLAAGILIYNVLPSTRFNRAVKAAEQYYADSNYLSAVEEYEKALALRPADPDISFDAASVICARAEELFFDGEYEAVLEMVERDLPLLSEEAQPLVEDYAGYAYDYIAQELIDEENFAAARDRVQEGIDKGYDLDFVMNKIDRAEQQQIALKNDREFLTEVAGLLDKDDYEGALNTFRDKYSQILIDNLASDLSGGVIVDVPGGKFKQIGLFYDDYYHTVYYGDFKGSDREGTGSVYLVYSPGSTFTYKTSTYCIGDWKNNKPNGAMKEYMKIYSGDELQLDAVITSTVKDGLYNGDVEEVRDGESFYGTYTEGKVNVIDETDPNGEANRVVMYNSDRSRWIFYRNSEAYNYSFGMLGFGEQ